MEYMPGLSGLELVGTGGSSTVYRAINSAGDVVAVKVLSGVWDEGDVRRFGREIEAMQLLADVAKVVPVLDSGVDETGSPFLVMPYYEKGSLNDHLKNHGPIPWQQATTIITQLAETLTQTHNNNIYHRDLKPANILQDNNNHYWLTDFGITEIADGRSVSTTAAYTPGYCPPETLTQGRKNTNGATVDTYGLTATLWALIAGHTPFINPEQPNLDPIVLLNNVATKPIGPPNTETPNWLNQIIDKGTAKNPQHRYQTIPNLLHDLKNQHTPEPTTQKRTNQPTIHRPNQHPNHTPQPDTTKTTTKQKPLIAAALGTTLLLIIATTAILLNQRQPQNQTTTNTAQPFETSETETGFPSTEQTTGSAPESSGPTTSLTEAPTPSANQNQTSGSPAPEITTTTTVPAQLTLSLSQGTPKTEGNATVVDYVVALQNTTGSLTGAVSCMALNGAGSPEVVAAFVPKQLSTTPEDVGCPVPVGDPPTQRWVEFSGPGFDDLVSNRVTW